MKSVKNRHPNDPNFLKDAKVEMHKTTTNHGGREDIRAWRSELEDYASENPSQPNLCPMKEVDLMKKECECDGRQLGKTSK